MPFTHVRVVAPGAHLVHQRAGFPDPALGFCGAASARAAGS